MTHRIFIAATALALTALTSGCSPSSRFSDIAAAFGNLPSPRAETPQPAPAAERPKTVDVAEADGLEDGALPVLAYLPEKKSTPKTSNPARAELNRLIDKYAALYRLPPALVHSVVKRESTYNPAAKNGNHWGLMQINYTTAKTMGYRGAPSGLFDAETNLKYAVKYLAGAYLVADGDPVRADRLYQSGYYYHAKRKGLLKETGLRP